MSVYSTASQSVSCFGETDVDLERACDQVFRELQQTLNNTHSSIRLLTQVEERNETFLEAVEIYHDILDYADQFANLMKELKGVCKQVLGKCPPEMKQEYKEWLTARSITKAEEQKEKETTRKEVLTRQ